MFNNVKPKLDQKQKFANQERKEQFFVWNLVKIKLSKVKSYFLQRVNIKKIIKL